MANRLADATSPYLLQHADNPVDWQQWGSDAFEVARRRDVPVFLSVGYAACHWCHVMAHESFEDAETAAYLNQHFVSVKVDREERPDVDAVYMTATQAMTGQGGWPMSVFLTPEGHPFYAGTYFPSRPAHGMPSFRQLLEAITDAWTQRRDQVDSSAEQIVQRLREVTEKPERKNAPAPDTEDAVAALANDFDTTHGGFGSAPKFPPSMVLEGLLRAAEEEPDRYDGAWAMARQTLEAMARGGIYDQLSGGFARYSVDAGWVVPHFEKMLYDNALLLGVYARAAALAVRRGEDAALFERVVTETVEWLQAEMHTQSGAFASSLDADSPDFDGHPHEGAYYVWTPEQLTEVLGAEAGKAAAEMFGVTEHGTFERGASTLRLPDGEADPDIRTRLATARSSRARPARDDKVIAAWNGWLIDALVTAGMTLDRPDWVSLATTAATAVRDVHWREGQLLRSSRDGIAARAPGTAEDYAGMALGAVRLATATGDTDWLAWSRELLGVLREDFAADDGGLADTSRRAEALMLRPRERSDNATPSGSATAVLAGRLLSAVTGDSEGDAWADRIARSLWPVLATAPRFAGWALADAVTQQRVRRGTGAPVEVAIVLPVDAGRSGEEDLVGVAWREAPSGSVVVAGSADAAGWPLLAGRMVQDGVPTAYVCRRFTCRRPVTTVEDLRAELGSQRPTDR